MAGQENEGRRGRKAPHCRCKQRLQEGTEAIAAHAEREWAEAQMPAALHVVVTPGYIRQVGGVKGEEVRWQGRRCSGMEVAMEVW